MVHSRVHFSRVLTKIPRRAHEGVQIPPPDRSPWSLRVRATMERRLGAVRIQAAWRGHVVRRELVHSVRRDFEETVRRLEGPLATRDANVLAPSRVGWKTHVSRPVLFSPRGETDDRGTSRRVHSTGASARAEASPVLDVATERRLEVLRRELEWARNALDDRRQHLRRLRRDTSPRAGSAGSAGLAT